MAGASRGKVIANLLWKFAESFGAQLVSFVVSIILARLLDPETFGLIGLVLVVTNILGVFVDSGFSSALIQKKDADDLDFSSVFWCNIAICIVAYAILFAAAPAIARFYETEELTAVLRVLGLVLMEPLVYFLGATETIYPYCVDYLRLILIGAPWMCASFVLNNLLRFEGSAFRAMVGLTAGGLLNMALDPLFIFTFDMGIAGAALATIVSQAISFGILYFQIRKHSAINLKLKDLRLSMPICAAIMVWLWSVCTHSRGVR